VDIKITAQVSKKRYRATNRIAKNYHTRYNVGMMTFQITLPESLQRFVQGKVSELGLDRPDQYIERLLAEEQHRTFDDYCMEKVQEAIDRDEWIAEEDFWKQVDSDTRQRRNVRKAGAVQ